MRVLLISHTCQSRTEGQPRAEQLGAMPGLELRVLVPDRWNHYGAWRAAEPPAGPARYQYQIGHVRFPWSGPGKFYLHYYPNLRQVLATFRPDIIDLWEEPWAVVSAHACSLRNRMLRSAKIVGETEQNINKKLPFPFEQIRRYTLRNTDFAICRNPEAEAVIRSKGYAGPSAIHPNAVDAELFRPMDRQACRARWNVRGFVVGYLGRLVEMKGLMDLVEALPNCPGDVNLLIVGSGPFRPALERRIAELGLQARTRFVAARPFEELPAIVNAMDALTLVSRTTPAATEQFGRVIIEAHACRVPVIGSTSGNIPRVVGGGGIIVPESDPAAIAAAIRRLHADPALTQRMGEIGRQQVEAHYTWRRQAEQMYDVYHRVLKNRQPT